MDRRGQLSIELLISFIAFLIFISVFLHFENDLGRKLNSTSKTFSVKRELENTCFVLDSFATTRNTALNLGVGNKFRVKNEHELMEKDSDISAICIASIKTGPHLEVKQNEYETT